MDLHHPTESRSSGPSQAERNASDALVAGLPEFRTVLELHAAHRFSEALPIASALARSHADSPVVWRTLAESLRRIGLLDDAGRAVERAILLRPEDPLSHVVLARIARARGHVGEAIDILESAVDRGLSCPEAWETLADTLWIAGEWSRLERALERSGMSDSPRMIISKGRLLARTLPERAIELWRGLLDDSSVSMAFRWQVGFEAVRLLDAEGRFREAFDLATMLHRGAAVRPDIDALEADVSAQVRMIAQLRSRPHTALAGHDPLGLGFVAGLPRSGTTLLEQMLDRHPSVCGIGEYEGVELIRARLESQGLWPTQLALLDTASVRDLARLYVDGAVARRRRPARWIIDKSMVAWRSMPAVAAVLPGATVIGITRDPRDCAISMFLAPLHPQTFGWNQDLSLTRRVIALERALMPAALEAFGVPHVAMSYEALVRQPRAAMMGILRLLQLPWDDAVLSPEHGDRIAVTRSNDQVRQPVSDSSVGRWRNYDFAFDSSWDGLAASHTWRVDNESARLAATESQSGPVR